MPASSDPLLQTDVEAQTPPEAELCYQVINGLQSGVERGAMLGAKDVLLTLALSRIDQDRITFGGHAAGGYLTEDHAEDARANPNAAEGNAEALLAAFNVPLLDRNGEQDPREQKDKANAEACDVVVAFRHGPCQSERANASTESAVNYALFNDYSFVMETREGRRVGGALQYGLPSEQQNWDRRWLAQSTKWPGVVEFETGKPYVILDSASHENAGQEQNEDGIRKMRANGNHSGAQAQRSGLVITLSQEAGGEAGSDAAFAAPIASFLRRAAAQRGRRLTVFVTGVTESALGGAEERVRTIVGLAFFELMRGSVQPWQLAGFPKGQFSQKVEGVEISGEDVSDPRLRDHLNKDILRGRSVPADKPKRRFFVQWDLCVDGLSMRLLRNRVFFYTSSLGVLLGVGYWQSHCVGGGVIVENSWLWLSISGFALIHHCVDEVRVVRKYAIPFVQEVGAFKVFSQRWGFGVWLAYGLMNSSVDFLGMASYTIVTATWIQRLLHCPDTRVDQLWAEALGESQFLSLLKGRASLAILTVFIWLATSFRLIHMFFVYWPWKTAKNKRGYDIKFNPLRFEVKRVEYVQFIAEQLGMDSVAQTVVAYRRARANANIEKIEEDLGSLDSAPDEAKRKKLREEAQGEWPYVMGDVYSAVSHMTIRVVGHKIVKAFAVSLQITLMAVDQEVGNSGFSRELISILLSFAASLPTFISIYETEELVDRTVGTLARREDFLDQEGRPMQRGVLDSREKPHNVRRTVFWFRVAWGFLVMVQLWAFAKLVMLFLCPHHLWNVKLTLNPMVGCVHPSN